MAKIRTHYDNLKVARNAPESVIRAAYKTLMQQYHPDKFNGPEDEALRIAKIIKQSFDVLIDPVRRAEHDNWIAEQEAKANASSKDDEKSTERGSETNWLNDDIPCTEEALYEIAAIELSSGNIRRGIMAKAVAETNGDQSKIEARYIQLRIITLQDDIEAYFVARLKALGCKVAVKTSMFGSSKQLAVNLNGKNYDLKQLTDAQNLVNSLKFENIRKANEDKEAPKNQPRYIECKNCGFKGLGKVKMRGSFWILLIIFLISFPTSPLLALPTAGIYCLWMFLADYIRTCPNCKAEYR